MTIRNLEIFTTVANLGSMSAAAKKLYITQPSVSLAIAEIEKEYDVQLFDRIGNHLHLTTTGQQLLLYTSNILQQYKEMELFLKDESQNASIRIGATATIGHCIIAPIIEKLKTTLPNIKYEITIASTGIIEDRLLRSELDIGFVEGDISADTLTVQPIIDDELAVICSNKHKFFTKKRLSAHELSNEVFVLRESSSGTRIKVENFLQEHNIAYQPLWSCYSFEAIKEVILHNLGISIMSTRLVSQELQNGTLGACYVDNVNLKRTFNIVYRKNKLLSEPLMQFIHICEDMRDL